jgi:tripartite-type tricarboxylate transporter receptor subunit TctC
MPERTSAYVRYPPIANGRFSELEKLACPGIRDRHLEISKFRWDQGIMTWTTLGATIGAPMSTLFEVLMTRLVSPIHRIALVTALVSAAPIPAFAQTDYPNRSIRIIVPSAPSGGPDVLSRILAEKFTAKWGHPVVVENRPGGSNNIAAQAVANAAPDGHTLLVTPPGPLVTHQNLFAKLGFEPAAFTPASILVKFPFVLAARSSLPISTLQELVAYAKANPGKLNFGTTGRGGPPHLMAEMLQARAGIRMTAVPYKGLVEAQTGLLGGQIDSMFHDLGNTFPHVQSGQIKALGITGESRVRELPDTPAIAEIFPGFLAISWFALVAPPRTPSAIAEKLSHVVAEAIGMTDVVERLQRYSMTPAGGSPAAAAAFLKEETDRWRHVILAAGIKPE